MHVCEKGKRHNFKNRYFFRACSSSIFCPTDFYTLSSREPVLLFWGLFCLVFLIKLYLCWEFGLKEKENKCLDCRLLLVCFSAQFLYMQTSPSQSETSTSEDPHLKCSNASQGSLIQSWQTMYHEILRNPRHQKKMSLQEKDHEI